MRATARLTTVLLLTLMVVSPAMAQETAPSPESGRTITMAFSGDVLIHTGVAARAATYGSESGSDYEFGPMFAPITDVIAAADLAIAHLEVPLSPTSSRISGYPRFNAPAELADAIAGAGYDGVSTASNHAMDQGATGITGTLDVLDTADLGHTGTARTEAEAASAMLYELGTATIGHLSYTYALNGIPLPAGEPWRANVIDAASIARRALDLKRAGADFVVLSLHWGVEYHSEPTSQQRALAEVILEDSVVDLIVGHHAHVVQPIDRIAGKYVIYGLGNSVSNQNGRYDPGTKDGAVVTVTLGEGDHGWEVAGIEVLPTLVEYPTYRILPAASESAVGEITPALRASRGRTVNVMTSRLPDLIAIPELIPDAVPPAPKPVLLRLEVPPSGPPATCEPGQLLACVS